MRSLKVPVGLIFVILLMSCSFKPVSVETTPTYSMENMVALTLEAYAQQITLTPRLVPEERAPGEDFSVEVTQAPATPTVQAQDEVPTSDPSILPESHYIWNILGHRQYYSIGCEASAADDWAKYFKVEVNEFKFQALLPLSDNPDLGFVGSVEGPWGQVPPYAYGVHAEPVAKLLREEYGLNAHATKAYTIDQIKQQIAADKPVIAWVIGNCVGGIPYEYTDKQGNVVVVAAYEHVVIITGYNAETIRYMNNGKFYDIPYEYFENSWSILGNMVIYLGE
jgi:uncharacterized protein YvpB